MYDILVFLLLVLRIFHVFYNTKNRFTGALMRSSAK